MSTHPLDIHHLTTDQRDDAARLAVIAQALPNLVHTTDGGPGIRVMCGPADTLKPGDVIVATDPDGTVYFENIRHDEDHVEVYGQGVGVWVTYQGVSGRYLRLLSYHRAERVTRILADQG